MTALQIILCIILPFGLLMVIFSNPLAKIGDSIVTNKKLGKVLGKSILFYFGIIQPIIGTVLIYILLPFAKLWVALMILCPLTMLIFGIVNTLKSTSANILSVKDYGYSINQKVDTINARIDKPRTIPPVPSIEKKSKKNKKSKGK